MTRSAQVDPAGLCLTSGGYGTGVMPNMYVEVTGNRQRYSVGTGKTLGFGTVSYGRAVKLFEYLPRQARDNHNECCNTGGGRFPYYAFVVNQ